MVIVIIITGYCSANNCINDYFQYGYWNDDLSAQVINSGNEDFSSSLTCSYGQETNYLQSTPPFFKYFYHHISRYEDKHNDYVINTDWINYIRVLLIFCMI